MPIIYSEGNVLKPKHNETAACHGVNTVGVMHRGIANSIRLMYPELFKEYVERCTSNPKQLRPGDCWLYLSPDPSKPHIFNLATQEWYGSKGRAKIEWVSKALKAMKDVADKHAITRIASPRIAAGLGGLEWKTVKAEIEAIYADWSGSLFVYETYIP